MEFLNLGEASQQGMHAFPQGTGALAVDHPYAPDSFPEALGEVLRQQFTDLRGAERVQVQFRGDRDAVGVFFHRGGGLLRSSACLVFLPLQEGIVRLVLPPAVKMVAVVQW